MSEQPSTDNCFVSTVRISYAHCTLGNHVYYSRYLDFFETARGELFRACGTPLPSLQEQDIIFPVTECALRYFKPARHDDQLDIRTWIPNLSRIRLRFDYQILRSGELLLYGSTSHVCTSIAEKPKRIPAELSSKLKRFLSSSERDFSSPG